MTNPTYERVTYGDLDSNEKGNLNDWLVLNEMTGPWAVLEVGNSCLFKDTDGDIILSIPGQRDGDINLTTWDC